jgi:hypothetical protein
MDITAIPGNAPALRTSSINTRSLLDHVVPRDQPVFDMEETMPLHLIRIPPTIT